MCGRPRHEQAGAAGREDGAEQGGTAENCAHRRHLESRELLVFTTFGPERPFPDDES
jgi:hypothetical protein